MDLLGRDAWSVVLCVYGDLPAQAVSWLLGPARRRHPETWDKKAVAQLARFLGEAGERGLVAEFRERGRPHEKRFCRHLLVAAARHGHVACVQETLSDSFDEDACIRAAQEAAKHDQVGALAVLCEHLSRRNPRGTGARRMGLQCALREAALNGSARTTRHLLLLERWWCRPKWTEPVADIPEPCRAVIADCTAVVRERQRLYREAQESDRRFRALRSMLTSGFDETLNQKPTVSYFITIREPRHSPKRRHKVPDHRPSVSKYGTRKFKGR